MKLWLASKHAGVEDAGQSDVPWLRISGGNPFPPVVDWVARVCVPAYEGPHCSNTTSWKGTVTLQINGLTIENVKMHTRGHVSTMFPKHQFSLKLPKPVSLLGMAPARKWVLATSFIDTSFQRNPTAFDIYRRAGGWATETAFVNMRWNGMDYGLYYIGERIEKGIGRLDVPEAHPKRPEESGYLLTIDWAKPGDIAIQTPVTSSFFSMLYPKTLSREQESFLRELLDTVDKRAAISPGTPQALAQPLAEVIDFTSFARFFITEELAKDVDGYAFSVYVTVKDGRLFHAAPWDFDLAFNFACMPNYFRSAYTNQSGPSTLGVAGWNVENLRDNAFWIGKTGFPGGSVMVFGMNKRQIFLNMWQHKEFKEAFVAAWSNARQGPLSDEALTDIVRRRSAVIKRSADRDLKIWSTKDRCGFWDCCYPNDAYSFEESSQHLEEYLVRRATWIDNNVDKLIGL